MTDTITVRVIRSLTHKNWKPLVLRNVDLDSLSLAGLKDLVNEKLAVSGWPAPFTRDLNHYDGIKLETDTSANNMKSSNALINTSTELYQFTVDSKDANKTLRSLGAKNESELSVFNRNEYETLFGN